MNNLLHPRVKEQKLANWEKSLFFYSTFVTILILGGKMGQLVDIQKAHAQEKIEIISPLPTQSATPSAKPTKADIIAHAKHGDIISRIHYLETTNGTAPHGYHKGCENKGMTNEFGYGVWSHICFATFEESVNTVDKWFDNTLKKKTLAQALCLYNIGENTSDCKYARDFINK